MPRFDSFEEGDIEEIIQEICCSDPTGPYFVVGGRFIRPDEIVSFQGPEESPSFTLKDGSTVTHNRFAQEENGDLLFRALRVIRRPIGKSQLVKPTFNRVLLQGTLLDGSGSPVNNLSGVGGRYESFDIDSGVIVGEDGSGNIVVEQLSDGSQSTISAGVGDSSSRVSPVADTNNNKIYYVYEDSGGNFSFGEVDYDGQNKNIINRDFESNGFAQTGALGVDSKAGFAFFANESSGLLYKIPLDGSNASTINVGAGTNIFVSVNKENNLVYSYSKIQNAEIYDYFGNSEGTLGLSGQPAAIDWFDGKLYVAQSDNDKLIEMEAKGENKKDVFTRTINANEPGLDVGLDLSAI